MKRLRLPAFPGKGAAVNPFIPLLAAAAILSSAPAGADCGSLDELRWLLGEWTADGSKMTFHESWTALGPRNFEGTGIERSKPDGAVKSGEDLRLLEMAGGVYYISMVAHNELPIAFRLTTCAGGVFVFENPAHDFPKRLEYRRDGEDRLAVRVSDGGDKGFTLQFARATAAEEGAATVLAAEDARFAAMIAGDAEAMRKSFADDLSYTHSSGRVESREQLIASIGNGAMRYHAITPAERQVVMLAADAALVRGTGRFEVSAGSQPLDLQIRYLAVYSREQGAWRLRSWQSLRLP